MATPGPGPRGHPGNATVGVAVTAGGPYRVPGGGGRMVVTADALVESVHFHADVDPGRLGHKSAAVNLSDLAAMGASARQLTMLLTQPGPADTWSEAVCAGARRLCEAHGATLHTHLGVAAERRISVQAIGSLLGGAPALTRNGARVGDLLAVTGTLGDAGAALQLLASGALRDDLAAHRRLRRRLECPTPRLAAGHALRGLASAALDLSDGLASDVHHLLGRGAPGAVIDVGDLPLSDALQASVPREQAELLALGAGDDYELCVTLSPAQWPAAAARLAALALDLRVIGRITDTAGLRLHRAGQDLAAPSGYRHRFGASP